MELVDDNEIIEAYESGIGMDLPIIKGEVVHKGGYHYYPQIHEVKEWIIKSGFTICKEDISDGYYHFIVKKANKNI